MKLPLILFIAAGGNFVITGSRLVLTLDALKLGATPFMVGAMQAAYSILPLLFAVSIGRAVDRLGTRWPILIATAILLVAPIAPALLDTMASLFFAAVVFGSGFLIYGMATQNLIGRIGGSEGRAARFSWMMVGTAGGNTLGPVLVGFTIDGAGYASALMLLMLSPLAILAWKLRDTTADIPGTVQDSTQTHESLLSVLAQPAILSTVIASTVFSVAWDTFTLMAPIHGSEIGLSPSAIGLVMGVFPGSMITVRLALPWIVRRVREWNILAAGLVACAIGYLAFPLSTAGPALTVVAVVIGIGLGVGFPLVLSLSFAASPPGRQAEVLGMRTAAANGCHVAVPVTVGAASGLIGLTLVFWLIAAMLGASAVAANRWAHAGATDGKSR